MTCLNKMLLRGLEECAIWCKRDGFGMNSHWKPKTMQKLAALGLVEKREGLRSQWGGSTFDGWIVTAAGRDALSNARENFT